LVTNLDPAACLNLVQQVFADFPVHGVAVRGNDPYNLELGGRTGFSLESWQQNVRAQIIVRRDGNEIGFTSKPAFQLFDWGRGKREAERMAHMTEHRLQAMGAQLC
jgi:hypothetical protein